MVCATLSTENNRQRRTENKEKHHQKSKETNSRTEPPGNRRKRQSINSGGGLTSPPPKAILSASTDTESLDSAIDRRKGYAKRRPTDLDPFPSSPLLLPPLRWASRPSSHLYPAPLFSCFSETSFSARNSKSTSSFHKPPS